MKRGIPISFLLVLFGGGVVHAQQNESIPSFFGMPCPQKQELLTPYACKLTENTTTCEIAKTKVEDLCPTPVPTVVPFSCPKSEEEYKDKCASVPSPNKEMCIRENSVAHASFCKKKVKSKECRIVSLPVKQTCINEENYVKPYKCNGSETMQECTFTKKYVGPTTCSVVHVIPRAHSYDAEVTAFVVSTKVHGEEGKCIRAEVYDQPFNCPSQKEVEICYPINKVSEEICDQEVIREEAYDCSEVKQEELETECSRLVTKIAKVTDPACSSFRRRMKVQFSNHSAKEKCPVVDLEYQVMETFKCNGEYPYSIPKVCFRETKQTIQKKCEKLIEKNRCKMVTIEVPLECKEPTIVATAVDCPDQKEDVVESSYKKTIQGLEIKYEASPVNFQCREHEFHEHCKEIITPLEQTCYAKMKRNASEECSRMELQEVCEEREIEIHEPCIAYTKIEEKYPCLGVSWNEKCGSGPTNPKGECHINAEAYETHPCKKEVLSDIICKLIPKEIDATCLRKETISYITTCFDNCSIDGCFNDFMRSTSL